MKKLIYLLVLLGFISGNIATALHLQTKKSAYEQGASEGENSEEEDDDDEE